MLLVSGRTKRVVSYGKRGQRVVARQDLDAFTSASDRRENIVPSRSSNSSLASKASRASIYSDHDFNPTSPKQNAKPKPVASYIARKSPGRMAFSPRRGVAVLGSGVTLSPAKVKPRLKGKASSLSKPSFTPFVDVEIIVLDDDGRKLSQEHRRVSQSPTNRDENSPEPSPVKAKPKGKGKALPVSIIAVQDDDEYVPGPRVESKVTNLGRTTSSAITGSDNSDEDQDYQPRRLAPRGARRARPMVISSESSDAHTPSPPPVTHPGGPSFRPPSPLVPPPRLRALAATTTRTQHHNGSKLLASRTEGSLRVPPSLQGSVATGRTRPLTPIRPGWRAALARNATLVDSDSETDDEDDLDLTLKFASLSLPKEKVVDRLERQRHQFGGRLEPEPRAKPQVVPSIPEPRVVSKRTLSYTHINAPQSQTASLSTDAAPLPHLAPLLAECAQTAPYAFSSFIETFPLDPLLQDCPPHTVRFSKIGEASYSEVFGIGDFVLKVVPLRDPREDEGIAPFGAVGDADADVPTPSECGDVLKEIIVTRAMGEAYPGFIHLVKTYLVRGKYPPVLLELWDEYNERKGSESAKPNCFTDDQVYAVIVLPNGGPDLEAFTFTKTLRGPKVCWAEACAIFWQVARALSEAEQLVRFEHRDLHWGQILVRRIAAPEPPSKRGKSTPAVFIPMDHLCHGVEATIIDLGLARMDMVHASGSTTYWTGFDPEIFEGEGDYQFDVYRMMKRLHKHSWEAFEPLTNVMWLHYLATKLLHSKGLRRPAAPRGTAKGALLDSIATNTNSNPSSGAAGVVTPEKRCYDSLIEVEAILGETIKAYTKPSKGSGSRTNRKTIGIATLAGASGSMHHAKDVVDLGISRGWIS